MTPAIDRYHFLQTLFGDVSGTTVLIKRTEAMIAVEPVLCKRATIYIANPVFGFLWHEMLTNASYIIDEGPFGSSYQRCHDRKRIRVKRVAEEDRDGEWGRLETLAEKYMLHFFATHEICLITSKATYVPFSSTSSANETIVCGPLKESWQIEELQALQARGWLVHYYADGRLVDGTSALELEGELDLDNDCCGRVFLDQYTLVIVDDHLEDNCWITEKTEIRAEDQVGIELALLGWT